jgi:transposase
VAGFDGTVGGMAYASDLTDEQWSLLEPVFNTLGKRGPKHSPDLRRVVDAMLYVSHTGCQWRFLPEPLGPWTRVWSQFRRWSRNGTWARAPTVLHALHVRLTAAPRRRRRWWSSTPILRTEHPTVGSPSTTEVAPTPHQGGQAHRGCRRDRAPGGCARGAGLHPRERDDRTDVETLHRAGRRRTAGTSPSRSWRHRGRRPFLLWTSPNNSQAASMHLAWPSPALRRRQQRPSLHWILRPDQSSAEAPPAAVSDSSASRCSAR